MPFRSAIAERLAIEQPLIQAPMASVSTPELAIAVANASGLGFLACGMLTPEQFTGQITTVRKHTNQAVGANFFVHDAPEIDPVCEDKLRQRVAPYFEELGIKPRDTLSIPPRFDDAMLEAVLSMAPAVVSFHFGLPEAAMMDALKSAG